MKLPFRRKKPGQVQIKQPKITFERGVTAVKDIIAPPAIEVDFNHLKITDTYFQTLFVAAYPRFVSANWLAPLINFDHSLDISTFIYPVEGKNILDNLRRKIAEMEAEIQTDVQRGRIANVHTQIALEDAKKLQEQLAKGAERFFQFGLYIRVPAKSTGELKKAAKRVEALLASLMIVVKPTSLQMEDGFITTLPLCTDKLMVTRNMDTTSLATTFPFTSSELSTDEGSLYGINEYNDSLVIFDRFSLENYNLCLFGKAGSGKSYCSKLEILRSLFFGTEVIIIDPENEYRLLSDAVDGQYIDFSFQGRAKINPFDLQQIEEEASPLPQKILALHTLLGIMLGELSSDEKATLDRALVATYQQKGISQDPKTHNREPPLMEDLYQVLLKMEDEKAKPLANRLERYVKGSLAGIFNQKSNIEFKNPFTVFGIKNLETELRPAAMFLILDFIWNRIQGEMKKRILVVDEAWYLMKHKDSALFLYDIAKRARKYYLGVTTITQDVEDFLASDHGKAIIQNSSVQILMKQSPAAIDKVAKVFYLSEGEKNLLLAADIGHGLFFAGQTHVALRVVASPEEHKLITTKPEELLEMRKKTVAEMKQKEKTFSATGPDQEPPLTSPPAPAAKIEKTAIELPPAPQVPETPPAIKKEEIITELPKDRPAEIREEEIGKKPPF